MYLDLKGPTEGDLSDELKDILRSIEAFTQSEILPLAAAIDESNEFPRHLWPKLGALGALGATAPAEYGGADLGYWAHALIMQSISRASASVGLSYVAHSNLCVNQLVLNASTEQKEKYLPRLISGEAVGALAMSETQAGSDVVSMRLRAEKKSDRYLLNGSKMWITNGPDADIVVVYAKTEPSRGSKGITAFIVEKSFPGFSSAQKLNKMGMRGSNTSELVFQNCEVPFENVLGLPNEGAKILMSGLDYERVIIAAGPLGLLQACLDLVLPYIHTREQFGAPIGTFELIQGKIADMYTRYACTQAYLYAVARACDRGQVNRKDAASVVLMAAENATLQSLDAIQILGGNGYIRDYPAERYLRDAKLFEIGAGTSEIRRMLIGRELYRDTGV